jgi:serine/threonine-protein kinase ULK/ATG1
MFSTYHKKIGNYFLIKQIGTGSFAKVYKGMEEKTKEIVAIKMIQKSPSSEKNEIIEKELNILKSLSHPNIIKLKDSKRSQNNIYLIFEYCHLGDLESYIKKFYFDPIQKKGWLLLL